MVHIGDIDEPMKITLLSFSLLQAQVNFLSYSHCIIGNNIDCYDIECDYT